jgi:hypothetical protein
MRRSTKRKQSVKHVKEYNRTTTETGTASCGIPPLIREMTRGQLRIPGVKPSMLFLSLNNCLNNLDNSFSYCQAF